MKTLMLPKTQSTTEAERGENSSFFFVTCDAVDLHVLMSCRGKNRHALALTEISNLGSLFIFSVLTFKTL